MSAFLLSISSAFYLYMREYKYDRMLAMFFVSVGLMQLSEYYMWIDQGCGNVNNYASKLAFVVLAIQPIVLCYGLKRYNLVKNHEQLINTYLILYLPITCYLVFKVFQYKKICNTPDKNLGHLVWKASNMLRDNHLMVKQTWDILYFMMFGLFVFIRPLNHAFIYIFLYLFTLLFALITTQSDVKLGMWKSAWCITTNIIPFLSIFIGSYFHNLKK